MMMEWLQYQDLLQGEITINLESEIGDVVLKRADGFYAYHLAVVVDDALQNITEIVRGVDLLYSTPIHRYLQQCLSFTTPQYAHLPVIETMSGEKLSKQTGASKVDLTQPEQTIYQLLKLLGQQPPVELLQGNLIEILDWAVSYWQISKIPNSNIQLAASKFD